MTRTRGMVKKKKNDGDPITGRLRDMRTCLGLSQKEFAKELGVSNAAISEMEKGKYYPGFEFYIKIVERFDVNLYYLLLGQGEMFRKVEAKTEDSYQPSGDEEEDLKRFVYAFERSAILRYFILGKFKIVFQQEESAIHKEITPYEERFGELNKV